MGSACLAPHIRKGLGRGWFLRMERFPFCFSESRGLLGEWFCALSSDGTFVKGGKSPFLRALAAQSLGILRMEKGRIALVLAGSLAILVGRSDMFLLVGTCSNQKGAPEHWANAQKIRMAMLITLVGEFPRTWASLVLELST